MKVRVKRAHDNSHGDTYHKKAGMTYEHPAPEPDIAAGLVEDAAKAAKRAAKPAAKPKAARKPAAPKAATAAKPAGGGEPPAKE